MKVLQSLKNWNINIEMMHSKKMIIYALSLGLCGLVACHDEKTELVRTLSAEKKSLTCEMGLLRQKTDSLWDQMGQYLDENLPTDLPPVERANMTNIRSAHLIALFKSFPSLDTGIQMKVNEAGKADRILAEQIKSGMNQLDKVEQRLNELLQQIEKNNQQQYQQLKQELRELEELPCRL